MPIKNVSVLWKIYKQLFKRIFLRMEQVSRDAGTSAEAPQPAIPQIASRVRPFNSEEKKTVVEKKKEKKEEKKEKKRAGKLLQSPQVTGCWGYSESSI